MMGVLETLRSGTESLIMQNPVSIQVHRVEYVQDENGGRRKIEADMPQFTGRLVPANIMHSVYRNEAGALMIANWLLIALPDADIKAGSDVEDTFTVDGTKYKITNVKPRAYHGELYAKHADVEAVI
jgi:hypothetical protein